MKVRCVDASGVTGVTHGKVYTVQSSTSGLYTLVGDNGSPGNFSKARFDVLPDVVVKVGQIWRNGTANRFEMTRFERRDGIDGWKVFGYFIERDGARSGSEQSFGNANEDYTPQGWDIHWQLEKDVAVAKQVVLVAKDMSDWRAWAHNKPGDCACGIARAMCSYHRA